MGVYCELLDTVYTGKEERAMALMLFKLRALTVQPCELTTTHAINSQLIIDDCAPDRYFRGLIESGRIRFRLRPGGMSVRQALIDGLKNRQYRMDTWPGIWPTAESNDWQEAVELRQAAIAVLTGNANRTTHDDLDKRLENMTSLLCAIEKAKYEVEEIRHGPLFRSLVKQISTHIPIEHAPLRSLLERVGKSAKHRQKRSLYRNRGRRLLYGLETQAKNIIDGLYHRAVAYSLEEKLLSMEREVPLRGAFHVGGKPDEGEVAVAIFNNPENATESALKALAIEWESIFKATQIFYGRQPSGTDIEMALGELVRALVAKRMAIPSSQLSAVVGKGISGIGTFLGGLHW